MSKYKTTQKECASKIFGVCSQCGGNLEPLKTVDNSGNPTYWSGCRDCNRFDNGTSIRVYKIAKKLVEDRDYRYYSHIEYIETDTIEERLYKTQSQISGACYLVKDVLNMVEKYDNELE